MCLIGVNMKKTPLKIITILVMIIVFSMTLGYSVLVQKLEIMGNAKIEASNYLIEITSITLSKKEGEAYQNANPTFNKTEGTMYSSIPNTSSGIIYKITIKNKGLTSGVLDYTFVSIDNSNIKYKIGGINNGDIIAAGESVDVTVEFEPWDDVKSISNAQVSSIIDFEFIPYSDSYSQACTLQWDGTSSSEPSKKTVYGVEYYQISNANELNWFTTTVNNGTKDINAILTKNICLNSKALAQIGTDGYNGIFDGQNRTIQGYNSTRNTVVEKELTYLHAGLFNTNNGTIKNLNLNGTTYERSEINPDTSRDYNVYAYTGGIVTENNGKISNCSVAVATEARHTVRTNCFVNRPTLFGYVGGVAAINNGVITGSYNKGALATSSNNRKNACTYTGTIKLYVGGLAGVNNGYVSDSYNNNTISSDGSVKTKYCLSYFRIGGIVGDFTKGGIKNSYNTGTIVQTIDVESGEIAEELLGGAIGNSAGTLTNVYYLDSVGYSGAGTSVSANDLSNLNIAIGNYYFKDTKTQNGGYPILKWQR